MQIIQSFALFDEGNPYFTDKDHPKYKDTSHTYLNFYSFFLSYITLNIHYHHVMMFCNRKAYDLFIRYIPYERIILWENEYEMDFWNMYKLMVAKSIKDDFIHVDPDIFVFDDLFRNFINGNDDILVQDILSKENNIVSDFGYENKEFLAETGILTKEYDGRCLSCGVLGLKKNVQEKYFNAVDILQKELEQFKKDKGLPLLGQTMILEEQLLYFVAVENDFDVSDIIPHDLINNLGMDEASNMFGYTHLWKGTKYDEENIIKIKGKIKHEYSGHYHILENYEKIYREELKQFNIRI